VLGRSGLRARGIAGSGRGQEAGAERVDIGLASGRAQQGLERGAVQGLAVV
jgi:hypothetical protein